MQQVRSPEMTDGPCCLRLWSDDGPTSTRTQVTIITLLIQLDENGIASFGGRWEDTSTVSQT